MKILSWIALALLAPSTLAAQDPVDPVEHSCARFKQYQPGPAARPTDADRKAFNREKNCFGHFYSADVKPDYDKGRRCCLVRGDCNRELAMVFANGWGTPRDFDAATYFLCRAGDEMAPFEQEGMLEFIQGMRTGQEKGALDYCDHITSGVGTTWCAGLDYDRKKIDWDRRIAAVEKTLGADTKPALAALRKAAEAAIEADAAYIAEPNRGGTIYPSVVLGGEMDRTDDFLATLERYTQKRAPEANPAGLKKADDALNSLYKTMMAAAKADDKEYEQGTAGEDALRNAQRAWIPYRDAWTAFYRLRWKGAIAPEILDREIATALTRERAKELPELGTAP
jgi:uncharacterized protein YecT (DUF1311 family)